MTGLDAAASRTAPAYNLTIADIHTYHVGVDTILVHNTCADPLLDDLGERYVRAKRTQSGPLRDPSKGHFYDDVDLFRLADDAEEFPAATRANGNCARVCSAGRDIGTDVRRGFRQAYTVQSLTGSEVSSQCTPAYQDWAACHGDYRVR